MKRDSLYHDRYIFDFKTETLGSLLYEFVEKALCLVCPVGQLLQAELTALQFFPGEVASDLIVIDFFYSHLCTRTFLPPHPCMKRFWSAQRVKNAGLMQQCAYLPANSLYVYGFMV